MMSQTEGSHFSRLVLVYLVLVLTVGGASAAGFVGNAMLQIGGAVLLAASLWTARLTTSQSGRAFRRFLIAATLLAGLQFIPLPPSLWAHLPGRSPIVQGYLSLDMPLPWLTVSLDPWASLASLTWLIPAAALFVAYLRPDAPSLRATTYTMVAVAVAAIALGSIQRGGQLYLYQITNYGLGTGFFANANHQATFLLATLALWSSGGSRSRNRRSGIDRQGAELAVGWAIATLLVFGIVMSESLAGLGLLMVVGSSTLLVHRPSLVRSRAVIFVGLALILASVWALSLAGSFESLINPTAQIPGNNRYDFLITGLPIALDMMPFGSGLGTFVEVYHWYEDPAAVSRLFVNHAHNDVLEILIETGVLGIITLALFLAWWVPRVRQVWTGSVAEASLRGATVMTGIILIHSLVDYPLRTAAMSSVFASGCAWLLGSGARFVQRAAPPERPAGGLVI